jgi:hypothetical protein
MNTSTASLEHPSDDRAELLDDIAELVRQKTVLDLRLRERLVVLWQDQTPFGARRFVADELAVVLAESHLTTQHWIDDALMFEDHPEVKALVDSGRWTIRHADAVLEELAGSVTRSLRRHVLELVLRQESARTPHQLRKATRAAVFLVDPDAAQKRAEKAREDRSVRSYDERNGSASLAMNGPKAAVAAAMAGLDAICLPKAPEDTRTLMQRRFDTLLGLISGEITPVGAHVQLLISLATLQGAEQPAEIPGLGFVTGEEARGLVRDAAEIRRVVVDAAGQLISVDRAPARPRPPSAPKQVRLMTDQVEPEPVTDQALADEADDLGHEVSDEVWLAAQLDAIADPEQALRRAARELYDYCQPCQHPPDPAAQAQLRQILDVIAADGRPPGLANILIDRDGTVRIHWSDPPDPEGGTRPPDPPPPHQDDRPPTPSDREWAAQTEPGEIIHSLISSRVPVARGPAPPGGWPTAPARGLVWSRAALTQAVNALLGRPVEPLPPDSSSYPFTGPLARHLKLRDQTCRFPGCRRLAVRCDSDHRIPWPAGPTSIGNGCSLCEHHHQAKHALFELLLLEGGTLRWILPSGHHADSPPRSLLRGW